MSCCHQKSSFFFHFNLSGDYETVTNYFKFSCFILDFAWMRGENAWNCVREKVMRLLAKSSTVLRGSEAWKSFLDNCARKIGILLKIVQVWKLLKSLLKQAQTRNLFITTYTLAVLCPLQYFAEVFKVILHFHCAEIGTDSQMTEEGSAKTCIF